MTLERSRLFWASIDAFYADRGGATSGESDFGVGWIGDHAFPRWRVSVVHDTGDVYAIEAGTGRVELLATLEHDCDRQGDGLRRPHNGPACAYAIGDQLLEGWAETPQKTLSWARAKLSDYPPAVTA